WWLQLNEYCKGMQLDENMRIRCKVRDESGKINVNLTNPRSTTFKAPKAAKDEDQQVGPDAVVRDALRCIFERRGISLDIVDNLPSYWDQEQGTRSDGSSVAAAEFTSVEDFASRFGITNEQVATLRPVLTAMPLNGAKLGTTRKDKVLTININT